MLRRASTDAAVYHRSHGQPGKRGRACDVRLAALAILLALPLAAREGQ
jgi:hypothetical protein